MSLGPLEDPDPLLEFSNEAGVAGSGAPPLEPGLQPVAATEDRAPIQQPPEFNAALASRVEHLERALEDSKRQLAELKSDVATLVRAVADNRKPVVRPTIVPAIVSTTRRLPGVAPKIAGLVLGAALGIFGWMYLSSDTDVSIAAPATTTVAAAESNIAGLAPNVASAVSDSRGLAPNVASAPESEKRGQPPDGGSAESDDRGQPPKVATRARAERGQPPAVAATEYVGTLAIDADPGGEVFVNRKRAGRTPLRLANLRAGSHLIWVEREGYRRWTRVVQVPADRVTRLSADLEPLPAR